MVAKWVAHLLPYRLVINIAMHVILFAGSYLCSLLVVNGLVADDIFLHIAARTIGPLIALRWLVFYYHDLFSGMWRYVSFEDLINIIRAAIISSFS